MWGALIGAGINIVANGIGSAIANKRKKEAEAEYQQTINEELSNLDNEINSNYLDSAVAQNALRKVTDSNTEALRQLNTQAIRGGATDEAKVAMASKLNKTTADVVGDLAALGEQRKDALKQGKRNLKLSLAEHRYKQNADTSGIDALLTSIGTAANALGSAIDSRSTTPTTTADTTATTTAASVPEPKIDRLSVPEPTGNEWEEWSAQDRRDARMRGASTQYTYGG